MTGGFRPDPRLGDFTVGIRAVAGFFAISGWLVVGSALANTFRQSAFFWAGAALYLFRDLIPVAPALALISAVVCARESPRSTSR